MHVLNQQVICTCIVYSTSFNPLGDKRLEESLMQEWFGILNRKNKLIKQQINLNILYVTSLRTQKGHYFCHLL